MDRALSRAKGELNDRRGRFSEDKVLAVLRVAEKHGFISDLAKTEPYSEADQRGIDIVFTDVSGLQRLQMKTSYKAAQEFSRKRLDIPVVWASGTSPKKIAEQLARRFSSLAALPELIT